MEQEFLDDAFDASVNPETIEKLKHSVTKVNSEKNLNSVISAISGFIPIVGAANSGVNIYRNYRNKQFQIKIINFLYGLSRDNLDEAEIQDFYHNVYELNHENISTTILNLLDRIDNLEKAEVIGNLTRRCIQRKYSYADFLRLCGCVERITYVDLRLLHSYREDNYIQNNSEALFSAGLISENIIDGGNYNDGETEPVECKYGLTKLGELLLQHGFLCTDFSYRGAGKQNPVSWSYFK